MPIMDEIYSWDNGQGEILTIFDSNRGWRLVKGYITGLYGRRVKTTYTEDWIKIEDRTDAIELRNRRVTIGNQCGLHKGENNPFLGFPFNMETGEWACSCVDASEEHATYDYYEQLQLDSYTIVHEKCPTHGERPQPPLYCNPERTHVACGCKVAKFTSALPDLPSRYFATVTYQHELVAYSDNADQFGDKFTIQDTGNIAFPALLRDNSSGLERIGRVIYKSDDTYHIVNFQFEDGTTLFNIQ